MKEPLKNFIDSNRPSFDDREPAEKTWHGIEAALPRMGHQSMWSNLWIWRAAALVFLGLSIYLLVSRPVLTNKNEHQLSQGEFSDLESYYSGQIAEKVAFINDLEAGAEIDLFTQDFQKLDAMYQVLREEMKNHPSEKVKDAMVLNLLVRIDLLNQQIKKLEDSRRKQPHSMV